MRPPSRRPDRSALGRRRPRPHARPCSSRRRSSRAAPAGSRRRQAAARRGRTSPAGAGCADRPRTAGSPVPPGASISSSRYMSQWRARTSHGSCGLVNETTSRNGRRSGLWASSRIRSTARKQTSSSYAVCIAASRTPAPSTPDRLWYHGSRDLRRQPPVGRPVESGRIDVGRQPLLEPVQLVGTDEMHLARKHGVVPVCPQQMGDRGRRRGQLRRIVEGIDGRRAPPGQHREARRRTQRRCAVGALEHRPGAGERVQVRCAHDPMPIRRQERGRELVGHHQDKVGTSVAHARLTAAWSASSTTVARRSAS